ncbi:glycosyltransferase [Coleofasciculus sp. LEGE 07081]|uniref:glycosyltransferase n=1 Tax=unclassified Coleofasciculus TaxID=2692782 RepID=UPI00187FBA18|nr:glycosyltransferase [Coleofasciculus sp. LEGE 07081]MBE9150863.1 glycosyltransferase [Coleofasciculus sp. LEGE 07092]
MGEIGLGITLLSLAIWIYLLCFHGQFWRCNQHLDAQATDVNNLPSVCAVIPARNEAQVLPVSLRSLLTQDYPGSLILILVDDNSTDGTARVAHSVGKGLGIPIIDTPKTSKQNTPPDNDPQLHILSGKPLPPGWTGKLWAIQQGTEYAQTLTPNPHYFLLTDADIEHEPQNLRKLVAKAQQNDLDLVSLMVRLRCESFWEKLLIPAFVFFFQKLYPFPWVNNPSKSTAAAAGGCILITREALNRIGGIQIVKNALIDDCTLAQAVKLGRSSLEITEEYHNTKGHIWLGLSDSTRSLRPYPSLTTIWEMVARTAFTQLNYSPWLLLGTLLGMSLIYIVPPVGTVLGVLTGNGLIAIASVPPAWVIASFSTWLLMTVAYLPTIRFYRCSPLLAFCLPAIAFLYTLMTLDSALRHWQGRGGNWKGRIYSG